MPQGVTLTNPAYASPWWQWASKRVLERDGFRCQIRLPGCSGRATTADHIVELADGGAVRPGLEGLQAACRHCNTAKRNSRQAARAKRSVRSW